LCDLATSKNTKNRAVVLLSGGLDSATVAACLQAQGFRVHALTVDYGQRHAAELAAAARIAQELGVVEHLVQKLDLRAIGGSALTSDLAVPKGGDPLAPVSGEIPSTYVPARNTLFLSLALAFAEARGAHDLGIGVNAMDYSGYPDCRPEFIQAFENLANLATREGVEGRPFKIHAPLQDLSKLQILQLAGELGVPVAQTLSCYDPSAVGQPCRLCEACRLRQRAEQQLADWDPCTEPVEVEVDVPAAQIHAVRHRNLRPDAPFEAALYDIDELSNTVHFLARIDGQVVGCATLLHEPNFGLQIRLRGMGVDSSLRGRGVGTRILRVCMDWAAGRDTGIWCNARTPALRLYARSGFQRKGSEFSIEGIGPHYVMAWPGRA
jgi:7-cyano-7-deazaguanine synthase